LARVGQLSRDKKIDAQRESDDELKALAEIYGAKLARVYTGADANEERLKTESAQSRIIQLSVRAVLSDANPLHSAALLASGQKEDGMLQPWELIGLNLKNEIAVMPDCEMAAAEANYGDAMTGLSWAWLVAGCPTVFLSQQKASPEASDLLIELHRNLKSRLAPAEALRRSALKMIKSDRAHPFYWSRMILLGRGK
ncbi:MAG TPA: CHAT domain-containing protein, partial [Blastocatellia bacterium]